jgi:hypothetical protein
MNMMQSNYTSIMSFFRPVDCPVDIQHSSIRGPAAAAAAAQEESRPEEQQTASDVHRETPTAVHKHHLAVDDMWCIHPGSKWLHVVVKLTPAIIFHKAVLGAGNAKQWN